MRAAIEPGEVDDVVLGAALQHGNTSCGGARGTLEERHAQAYTLSMSERSAPNSAPPAWRESLLRSKAQIAAGESVPLLPILDRLRASAERLESELGVNADGDRTPVPQR